MQSHSRRHAASQSQPASKSAGEMAAKKVNQCPAGALVKRGKSNQWLIAALLMQVAIGIR